MLAEFMIVFLFGMIIERAIEWLKKAIGDKEWAGGWLWGLVSFALGLLVTFTVSGANVFVALGVEIAPMWVSNVFAGAALGAGSNFLHDLVEAARGKIDPASL